jgi:ABC-2 type transport system ATP-binding protein
MSIKAENITKIYGTQKALDNISFEIKTGEIAGFIGPNGAGKSTTMKIITGFIPQTSGNVFVNDINVFNDNIKIRKIIGYLPEQNPLYLDMYVREYLKYTASYYLSPNETKKAVDRIISLTGLAQEQNKLIGSLSKGYKQRVGLAQALIHDPEVLILDEPTSGLDPNQIIEIRNLISEIGKNKTIMLSTHIMQEVEAICHKIIIINKGQIVANNSTKQIIKENSDFDNIVLIEFGSDVLLQTLLNQEFIKDAKIVENNKWLIKASTKDDIRQKLFNFAVSINNSVLTMQKQEKSLEDLFKELTKNN